MSVGVFVRLCAHGSEWGVSCVCVCVCVCQGRVGVSVIGAEGDRDGGLPQCSDLSRGPSWRGDT